MSQGERGMQGDIGHEGPRGHQGTKGERGAAGDVPFILRHLTAAFILLLVGVVFAINQSYETSRNADRRFCVVAQENRNLLRDLINRTGTAITVPPNASDDLRKAIEQSRVSGQEFRDYANDKLRPVKCPR